MKLKNSTKELFRESDLMFASEGKLGVQRDYGVRVNQPAAVQTRYKWIIGDVTEVLDHSTWKLGKIAKMLKNNYFVIRLADCIQLKEFHISSLRVPSASHSNHVPAAEKEPVAMNQKHKPAPRGQTPSNILLTRSNKKRKPTANIAHHPAKRSHPQFASKTCAPNGTVNCFQYRSPPQSITEDTEECSVASCSINDPELHSANAKNHHQPIGFSFPDDAMSACQCTSSGEPPAIGVHELELEAYQSTMRALYASGPLTWEQESLLTNLRLSLNISNEEHLLNLRHLLASSVR